MSAVIIVQRQSELLEIVPALYPTGRFAGLLDSGQKQRNQNCDDCNHNQ
jgi:hypothetical protein